MDGIYYISRAQCIRSLYRSKQGKSIHSSAPVSTVGFLCIDVCHFHGTPRQPADHNRRGRVTSHESLGSVRPGPAGAPAPRHRALRRGLRAPARARVSFRHVRGRRLPRQRPPRNLKVWAGSGASGPGRSSRRGPARVRRRQGPGPGHRGTGRPRPASEPD